MSASSSVPLPSTPQTELPCPACGYDLRAAVTLRCPECGSEFTPDELGFSHLPWFRRHQIGLVRAYLDTALITSLKPRQLSRELARAIDDRAARAFMNLTSLPLAALVALLCVASLFKSGVNQSPLSLQLYYGSFTAIGWTDLIVPLMGSSILWTAGLLPAFLLLLLPRALTLPFILLRRHDGLPGVTERAASLTRFLTLFLWPIALGLGLLILTLANIDSLSFTLFVTLFIISCAGLTLGFAGIGFLCVHLLRGAGAGWGRTTLGVALILAQWTACVLTLAALFWLTHYALLTWNM